MINQKVKEAPTIILAIIALLYIFKNLLKVVSKLLSFHKIFFVSVGTDKL